MTGTRRLVLHRYGRGPGNARPLRAAVELAVGTLALAVVALVGLLFVHRPWPDRLDSWVYNQLAANYSSPWAHHVTALGSKPVLVVGVVVLFGVGFTRDWVRAAACAIGPLATVVIVEKVAKPLVGQHAGPPGSATYPSGTVACVVALSVGAILVTPQLAKLAVAVLGAVATVAVCIAVVVLRWHSPTDALGGLGVGLGVVLAIDGGLHLAWWLIRRIVGPVRRPLDQQVGAGAGTTSLS